MPTFLNPATNPSYKVQDINGNWVVVKPGHSVQSYDDLTVHGFTLSSTSPVGYRSTWTVSVFSGEAQQASIAMPATIREVEMYNRSYSGETTFTGQANIYFNSRTYPVAAVLTSGRGILFAEQDLKNKVSTIIIEVTGGATIVDTWIKR